MPRFFERRKLRLLRRISPRLGVDVGKYAILAVNFRRCQFFAAYRDDALANFSRGLGEQLLKPRAQVGDFGEVIIVTLSRPLRAAVPRMIPSVAPGFSSTEAEGPHARTISCARSRNFFVSYPITAAGTMPKCESAE